VALFIESLNHRIIESLKAISTVALIGVH